MALFLTNICKHNGCGKIFPTLSELILHIEKTHIDFDPKVMEQKEQAHPTSVPLSYILPYTSEVQRNETPIKRKNVVTVGRKPMFPINTSSIPQNSLNNTVAGSNMDGDEMVVTQADQIKDFWTSEKIMQYGGRPFIDGSSTKPYCCPVPGCSKRYKNANGLKYHSQNGHKREKLSKAMMEAQQSSAISNATELPGVVGTSDTSFDGGSYIDNSDTQ